jgi:hypothetical protein
MSVAIYTSISAGCAEFAKATTPSKTAYCVRHGYSLVLRNRDYYAAQLQSLHDIYLMLNSFDVVWALDADCLITGTTPIEMVPGIGPNVTVCEEMIVGWNRLNCGSMIWRSTDATRMLLGDMMDAEEQWRQMPCGWQTWLADREAKLGNRLKVVPQRSFNSVTWNHSGGGSHWQPGDLVYHPCGIVPHTLRAAALRDIAATLEATP